MVNKEKFAFVIMPFSRDSNYIYENVIKKILEEVGFKVSRADNIEIQGNILKNIILSIYNSDLVIAELTSNNPNVLYELGIAHSFQKNTIMLTQSLNDLPFNLKSYRVIEYNTDIRKINIAEEELRKSAGEVMKNNLFFGNPVSDFLLSSNKSANELFKDLSSNKQVSVAIKDEEGFLDHLINWNEGMNEITKLIEDDVKATDSIRVNTEATSEKINNLNSSSLSNSSKMVLARNLIKEYSEYLNDFQKILNENNNLYFDINNKIENSLEYIINFQIGISENDNIKKSFDEIFKLEKSINSAINGINTMKESIIGLPRMEKNLNMAIIEASNELEILITNMTRTLSQIQRARSIIKSKNPNIIS